MDKHTNEKPIGEYVIRMIEKPVLFHAGLWLIVLLILTGLTSLNGNWPFLFYLLNMLVAIPAMMLFAYSMSAVGNRMLFQQRKPGLFFLIFALLTIVYSLLIPLLNHFVFFEIFYPRVFEPNPWFNWKLIPQNFILLWFPYFIISIKTFFVNWFKAEQEKLIIHNKQLLSEIQLMKIKLHPHFLFNTLNNLYAMSQRNSEKTGEYILKLSDLFRVMLYECNKDFYPLGEELLLIENYVDLEKIRYDERLKLDFEIPKHIDQQIIIPPMLFFTFVENAFKHGCRNEVGKPYIKIKMEVDDQNISFQCHNSVPEEEVAKTRFGGIGLDNTHKRLDLIYKNKYAFNHGRIDHCYRVELKIPKLLS